MQDTIVAVSSAPADGTGWRAIIRMSGGRAFELACSVAAQGAEGDAKVALVTLAGFGAGAAALPGMLLKFAGPRSFTGEDVAELHVPAAGPIVRALVERLIAGGARQAVAGEFTARAFFHGKMDLTQAEGIAATIGAQNETELRAAAALREGLLHREVARTADAVGDVLAQVEASIDFSDEADVAFITADAVSNTLAELHEHLDRLLITAVRVDRLNALPTVVLIGKPNVGKSSLINVLTGQDRAMVSPVAGTTRDMLSATLHTASGDIRLLDVPGEEIPTGEISGKMMDARRLALLEADLVIRVVDHRQTPGNFEGREDLPAKVLTIQNKADLLEPGGLDDRQWLSGPAQPWGRVSAKTGQNIGRLREVIAELACRGHSVGAGQVVLNQRHRLILQDVKTALGHAARHATSGATFQQSLDLLAADLRHALDLLGQISGVISPDEVLRRVFGQFCIGK